MILSLDAWVKGGACSTTSCKYLFFSYDVVVRARITVARNVTHLAEGDFVIPDKIVGLIYKILKLRTLTFSESS